MDLLATFWPFIVFVIICVIFLTWLKKHAQKKKAETDEVLIPLRSQYKDQKVFLCYDAEDLGRNLVQLWGESMGVTLRAGIKIVGPNNMEYTVKDVYADGNTPEIPDPEVAAGTPGTPIVIETTEWDWEIYKQKKEAEKVLVLKIK